MRSDRNLTEVRASSAFAFCMVSALGMWAVWCVLMATVGEPFSSPLVQALAEVAILLVPALAYLRSQGLPADAMGLRYRWRRGVLVGVVTAAVIMASVVAWLQLSSADWSHTFDPSLFPTDPAVWLSAIVFIPFTEELLFRRVAIDHVSRRHRASVAILFSSLLFVGLHLPWWILSGDCHAIWIVAASAGLMLDGLVFGTLYQRTGSLWASLLPRCVCSLASMMIS